jgi:hypothetical protein
MVPEEFFNALLLYARRESQLLRYARHRAARGALRRLDWELLSDAREENARNLHDTWVRLAPSDRA